MVATLQSRFHALNELQLTLKHAHWNVVGRDFIGFHTMLGPQIELVRAMIDQMAERIATFGVSPNGLPGASVKERDWQDYGLGRGSTQEQLTALDHAYGSIVSSHRDAIAATGDIDPVTEDMLIGQTANLELFQWLMRAHLENDARTLGEAKPAAEKTAPEKKTAKTKKYKLPPTGAKGPRPQPTTPPLPGRTGNRSTKMSNEDSTNSSKHETDHGVAETLGRKPTGDEDLNQEGLKQDEAKQNKPETAPTNV